MFWLTFISWSVVVYPNGINEYLRVDFLSDLFCFVLLSTITRSWEAASDYNILLLASLPYNSSKVTINDDLELNRSIT